MKQAVWAVLTGLVVFSLCVGIWVANGKPALREGSTVTREGVVTDRAMSDGIAYITVEFSDGTAVCCWELYEDAPIPDGVGVGRHVAITYGIEEAQDRCVFLDVKLEGRDYKT